MIKKLLFIGGFYLAHALESGYTIEKNMQVKVKGINGVHFSGGNVQFNLTIGIVNPTDKQLKLNTFGFGSISEIKLYDSTGKYLGSAYPKNMTAIDIKPNTTTLISNVPTTLSLVDSLNTLLNNFSTNPSNYQAKIVISVFGKTFIV